MDSLCPSAFVTVAGCRKFLIFSVVAVMILITAKSLPDKTVG